MCSKAGHGEARLVDVQRCGSEHRTLRRSASFFLGGLGGPGGMGILAGAFALSFPGRRLGFCAIVTKSVRVTGPVGHEAFDGGVRLTLRRTPSVAVRASVSV